MKTEIKKLEKAQIEVFFEMPATDFVKYFDKALLHVAKHVKVDGFRKGHVPANMVEERVSKEQLLMEAGDLAVKDVWPKFVEENKLEPIGEPELEIKKIAKGSEFVFTLKVTVIPEISLPDYKSLAGKIKAKDIEVTEKELEETITYLQKSRAKFTLENRPAQDKDFVELEYSNKDINGGQLIKDRFILGEGGFLKDFEENVIGMKAGQEKEFTAKFPESASWRNAPADLAGKPAQFKVKMISVQKMELAELNDEFAKALGAFDTFVALKENLKQGISEEKKETEKQHARGEMLEAISAKTKFEVPEKMVGYEEEQLLDDLKVRVNNQFNMSFENYLASVKKTEEELKATFKLEAEKRIRNFLVLREIGKLEKVEVTQAELAEEMQRVAKNYTKDQLSRIDIGQLTEYSKGAIFNEKVFAKLESFAKI